ncbi:hypothetical protein Salat_1189800 [Sesamum alatum]|uniref:Retrotransposon Copia-like N-terminal domain-containing protein n=1 Tax=Sesamum alatum TaxID=300844 RepID=A0AAE2CP09_9LAMI|nr:hypothetical protein Salat_1189800 [Sesamum alatum]
MDSFRSEGAEVPIVAGESQSLTGGRSQQTAEGNYYSYHSVFTLTSSPLDGDNYLIWSKVIKFTLGARKKPDFDGRAIRPVNDSDDLDECIRKDYMVITWMLNCVSKAIVGAFIQVCSARVLWLELEVRYGDSNGPMIYILQREIALVSQRDLSVTEYYTKIKQL